MKRTEWLRWRQQGLGGSDIAAILGLSPWSAPYDVWLSKTQPLEEDEDSPAMARGRRLEGAVLEWMAEELGADLSAATPATHPEHEWARATPDGYLVVPGGPLAGAEAKTSRDRWDTPPVYYELQCRWYQAVTDTDTWHLGCYFPVHDEWRRWTYTRDLEVEAELLRRAGAWWERHVVGGEPPPVSGSRRARRHLRRQYGDPNEEWVTDDDLGDLVAEYVRLGQEQRDAEARRDAIANRLRQRIGDATGARGRWGRIKWSRHTRRYTDYKRLRAERPDVAEILDEYTEQRPTGRLAPRLEE